jgi:HEAT repeat protein
LAQIEGLKSAEERACLLKFALAAKHPAVRRAGLRRYVSLKTDDCNQSLRTALFDSVRGVREVAAFELKRMTGESALPIWRAAITHPRRRVSEVAIMALCESGEPGDVEDVARAGVARNAILRASILRGLWRVGSADLEPQLISALTDRSTRVIRHAAEIYRNGTIALDTLTLEDALGSVEDSRVPYLVALSNSLGKWESLEFLLHQALSKDYERAECAADHLDRWILTANRRFVAPSVHQVQRLTSLLRAAQSRHSRRDWRPVDRGLAAFT